MGTNKYRKLTKYETVLCHQFFNVWNGLGHCYLHSIMGLGARTKYDY